MKRLIVSRAHEARCVENPFHVSKWPEAWAKWIPKHYHRRQARYECMRCGLKGVRKKLFDTERNRCTPHVELESSGWADEATPEERAQLDLYQERHDAQAAIRGTTG